MRTTFSPVGFGVVFGVGDGVGVAVGVPMGPNVTIVNKACPNQHIPNGFPGSRFPCCGGYSVTWMLGNRIGRLCDK